MDRVSAANYTLNAQGKRVFQDTNLATGITGTEFAATWHTGVQESIVEPAEGIGLIPSDADNTQLFQVIERLSGSAITSLAASTALAPAQTGLVFVSAAAGNVVITLPLANALSGTLNGAAQVNRIPIVIVRTDTSTNTLTYNCSGANTLGGGAVSGTVGVGQAVSLVSDGASVWWQTALSSASPFLSKVANYVAAHTILASENGAQINAGAVPISLPLTAGLPVPFTTIIRSTAVGTTINPNGATVNMPTGATTGVISLPALFDFLALLWDGTVWDVVGGSRAMLNASPPLFSSFNNVTASRAIGAVYTNTTGRPMWVSVVGTSTGSNANLVGIVAGNEVQQYQVSTASIISTVSMMVPPGATYYVTNTGNSYNLSYWSEIY